MIKIAIPLDGNVHSTLRLLNNLELKIHGSINTQRTKFRVIIDPIAINYAIDALGLRKIEKDKNKLLPLLRGKLIGKRVTIMIQ